MKVNVYIKPKSSKGPLIEPQADGSLVAYVREPAVDHQANEALIDLLAEYYDASKSQISIVRGVNSRHKIIEVNTTWVR